MSFVFRIVWQQAMAVCQGSVLQRLVRFCAVGVSLGWVGLASPALAQTVPVVFRVDMAYASVGAGDQVVLRGEGAELGNWEGTALPLTRVGQSATYRVRVLVPDSLVGRTLRYKFAIHQSDGTDVWEEGANRWVDIPAQGVRLPVVFFSDIATAGLAQDQAVRFVLDAREALFYEEPPDGMALLGGQAPLGWTLESDRTALADPDADGMWEATVVFPQGTRPDVAFKLAYQIEGRWIWEALPGHSDHVVLLDEAATQATYHLRYDGATRRIVPATTAGLLDQYGAIAKALGARGSRSDYRYYEAMQLLDQGKRQRARRAYEAYASHWKEDRDIDDFDYAWAHDLAKNGDIAAALAYCEERYGETVSAKRKAHFVYLSGEILLNQGQHDEAEVFFNRVLTDFPQQTQFVDYSRQSLALGRLQTNRTDEALPYLEALANTTTESHAKRQALKTLARVYEARADSARLAGLEQRLMNEGTPAERWQARYRMLKRRLKRLSSDEAVTQLDHWLAQYPQPRAQAMLLHAKSRYLKRIGQTAEAQAVRQELQQRYPKSRFSK